MEFGFSTIREETHSPSVRKNKGLIMMMTLSEDSLNDDNHIYARNTNFKKFHYK